MVLPLFYAEAWHVKHGVGVPNSLYVRSSSRDLTGKVFRYIVRPLYLGSVGAMVAFMATWTVLESVDERRSVLCEEEEEEREEEREREKRRKER
jgi:heme exporter protein D